jgi:hypothetical protein
VTFLQKFSQHGRRKVKKLSNSPISPLDSPAELRATFLGYITGTLPDADRIRLDEQLLADHDLSDAVAECEQQLIDDYVLHQLSPEDARTVGLWIEASPNRVLRAQMARALLQRTPQTKPRTGYIGVALAIAACLIAAATLYLFNHRTQPPAPLTASSTALRNLPAPAVTPSPSTTSAHTIKPDVILIAAERLRGEQRPAIYQIHRQSPIQLQVIVPNETATTGYSIRISRQSDATNALIRQTNLTAQSLAGQRYLTITLPPESLLPATYTASITHQNDTLASTFILKWAPQ